MEIFLSILIVLIGLYLTALPVKLAATAMGAQRTGVVWCLLALVAASFMHTIGLMVPIYGSIFAFLLSSAAFAAILGTGFLRGMGIAVLHVFFAVIVGLILAAVLGVNPGSMLRLDAIMLLGQFWV